MTRATKDEYIDSSHDEPVGETGGIRPAVSHEARVKALRGSLSPAPDDDDEHVDIDLFSFFVGAMIGAALLGVAVCVGAAI